MPTIQLWAIQWPRWRFCTLQRQSPELGQWHRRPRADLFDPFSAIILRGIGWILEGGADDCPAGLQDYPRELEQEIAELTAKSRA